MNEEKNISVSHLVKFLDINYQTFHSWINNDVFGGKFKNIGRGKKREFGFDDVCAVLIAQNILNITKSFEVTRNVVENFYKAPDELKNGWNIFIYFDKELGPQISWMIKGFTIDNFHPKVVRSLVFIPVQIIREEVKIFFSTI